MLTYVSSIVQILLEYIYVNAIAQLLSGFTTSFPLIYMK